MTNSISPEQLARIAILMMGCVAAPIILSAQNASGGVEQLMQQGSEAMHRGDAAAAEKDFARAAALSPELPDAYLGMGLAELKAGDANAAVDSLKRAIALNPQMDGAHMFLGIALYQRNEMEAAAQALKQELQLQPMKVEALNWLGIIELGSGHPELATEPFDRAVALSPRDPNLLYYQGKAHGLVAQDAYRALYRLDPDSRQVHQAMGEIYSTSDQPEKAIAEFQAALAKQPGNADLYESLANEDQKLSRFDDAIKVYEQELALSPHNGIALYNLGKIYVERGDPAKGVPLLRGAAEAHTVPAPTEFYLGLGLAKLGQDQEAAQRLEHALASNPSDFIKQGAYFELVKVYQRLNRKEDSQRALEELKKLKGRTPAASMQQ